MRFHEDRKVAIDTLRNYLQEYHNEVIIRNIVDRMHQNKINIIAPTKKTYLAPKRWNFVDRAAIESEAHQAASTLQLDPVSQPVEFKALLENLFAKYE